VRFLLNSPRKPTFVQAERQWWEGRDLVQRSQVQILPPLPIRPGIKRDSGPESI
jgi:hypothetical protein